MTFCVQNYTRTKKLINNKRKETIQPAELIHMPLENCYTYTYNNNPFRSSAFL